MRALLALVLGIASALAVGLTAGVLIGVLLLAAPLWGGWAVIRRHLPRRASTSR